MKTIKETKPMFFVVLRLYFKTEMKNTYAKSNAKA